MLRRLGIFGKQLWKNFKRFWGDLIRFMLNPRSIFEKGRNDDHHTTILNDYKISIENGHYIIIEECYEISSSTHIQKLTETSSALVSLVESLPTNFTQMLDKLIESKNVTEENLAEESNVSVKTIQRLRHHDPKGVTLEKILQICIGLHLHPILSEYLLRAAGQHFMDTKLHTMYKFLLYTCYNGSVEECNELLKKQGFPALGKAKK